MFKIFYSSGKDELQRQSEFALNRADSNSTSTVMKTDCLSILQWNLQSGPGVGQWSIRDLESNLYFGYNYDLAIEAVTEEVFWTIVFSPPNFPNHYQ